MTEINDRSQSGTVDFEELLQKVRSIGSETIAVHADSVDKESRFPAESIDALRGEKLLSAYVPVDFGGMGLGFANISTICETLGQYCASTAMIFAMHQIQVASIVHHSLSSEFFETYLRDVAKKQRLISSATSEIGVGGDLRSSVCSVVVEGRGFQVEKRAPVISYGADADDNLLTARRAPDSPASDQVAILVRSGEYTLNEISDWDSLGLRGTRSCGFELKAEGNPEQILPVPFADIAGHTMLPASHITWASVWLGIATDAVNRARAFVRAEARKTPDVKPAASLRLAEVSGLLHQMRDTVRNASKDYETLLNEDSDALTGFGFALRMNNVKVNASQLVVKIVSDSLLICGIGGYRNDSKFSLARHIRDALSAPVMINNDRILGASASMLLVHKGE